MREMIRSALGSLIIVMLSFHAFAAPSLTISNFAGNGTKGSSGDGGPATEAQLNFPTGISRGPDGALYICDTGNHRVRKVARDGIITTIAGTGTAGFSGDGGPAVRAQLNEPHSIGFDKADNLCICDVRNHRIRKVDAKTGKISTWAGTGKKGFTGNDGPAKDAELSGPKGLAIAPSGRVYFADTESHTIRMIDP